MQFEGSFQFAAINPNELLPGLRTSGDFEQPIGHAIQRVERPTLAQYELRNIHTVASLIARCALAREESRGAHYREDFPSPRPEFQKHSRIARENDVKFE